LHRDEVRKSLLEAKIPHLDQTEESTNSLRGLTEGFSKVSSYMFLGKLAWILDDGGAYTKPLGDGRDAMKMAYGFCDALFQHRYCDVECFTSSHGWTPWFFDINWDWTAILIDLRQRIMWVLVMTDTD
jgi:hypothetical protein